jgi:hypothetical protein
LLNFETDLDETEKGPEGNYEKLHKTKIKKLKPKTAKRKDKAR